jgi:hypothetical protein
VVAMKVPHNILDIALAHYAAKGAVYLRAADVERVEGDRLVARGDFAIQSSSYTSDTGHFNAAEFIICANQLLSATYVFAAAQACGSTVLNTYKDTFGKLLIVEAEQKFRRMIAPASFFGEISIGKGKQTQDYAFVDADIKFGDQDCAAKATGRYRLCLPLALYKLTL